MIGIDFIYTALGCFFVYAGARSLCAGLTLRSILESTFWTLYGLNFLLGNLLSDFLNGVLVLLLTTLATGMVHRPKPRPSTTSTNTVRATPPIRLPADDADTRRSPLLFVPLLTVPLFVVILTWWGTSIHWGSQPLIDPQRLSQVAYVIAVMAGLGVACAIIRPRPLTPFNEGVRLSRQVGWPVLLPQMLAALGGVYMAAGLNTSLSHMIEHMLPSGAPLCAVLAYTGGTALLTMLIGNAFAAFPVTFGAIGLPFLVTGFGASAAMVAAVGMLAGFCGTLITPMAVNFNIVPVSLLGLHDRYAVIRTQAPTALILFISNTLLLYLMIRL
ncbi:DUF979 domain-containing protein [Gluconacetobacter entanii]|uniref:DUF979 domain-containing protein n=1 Tax=Gluconacetobacter entanii TaxID=108528 RepID=A0ABT3KAG6_9PROT|nr:DUF979 family protein [Gluconacetobacter entanii]MCW4592374.1 DUF979 domain-containing protein [Gluconacetobacter entanii]MCW4595616.1 DUF979 domain-containing protein [Gluconacetobacter entanii]NPC87587.1 DUF979 family protein [Gluconacetobacter entanii]